MAILVFMTFASGCPYYSTALPTAFRPSRLTPNNPVSGIYHVVGRNEGLSDIAKAYAVDLQNLAEVNNLTPPYSIRAGSRIFIPGASRKRLIVTSQRPPAKGSRVQDFRGSLAWPVNGNVISQFGARNGVQYNGITIQAKEGTPVAAAADGQVGRVKTIGEYGKVVLIEHPGRLVTVYAHLKEVRVTNGQPVKRGEIIGTVGTSGRVHAPSLYFEVRSRSKPRNPIFFLGPRA
ncbi:MAG: peptidoglycan DD-metalloendopeptidase family protein [Desulfomonilaceae bacterium]